jgi:hypothetical protein
MEVSELQINDKAMMLIMRSLALEAHDFAASCGIPHGSVEDQLSLVFGVIHRHLNDLLEVRNVPATDTADVAAIRIGFSNVGYRLAAQAAKDQVARLVD